MGIIHLTGPVIAGDGIEHPEAWVSGGRIWLRRPEGEVAETLPGWVIPGLVDVHCHIGLGAEGAVSRDEAVAQAEADRDSGVLLVRDAGSPSDTSWVHDRDDLPRLIRSGRHLARPKRYLRYFARELDDVALLPEAVAQEAASGDGWVKLVGDWIDRDLGAEADLRPLWPREILIDAVAAAHDAGARVTVHTFSTELVDDLFDAGVDGIEHGTGMTPDHMAEAARRGVPVTPTLLQVNHFRDFAAQAAARYPRFAERMRTMYGRRRDQIRAFHSSGVPLLMGSDAGGTITHGSLPRELTEIAQAGVPVIDVVASASWRARDFLGVPGIEDGASADVVVYSGDPRLDIGQLARPTSVILRGRRH